MGDACSPGRAAPWREEDAHCPSGKAPSGHRAMGASVGATVTATVTAVTAAAAAAAGGESGLQAVQAIVVDGRHVEARNLKNRSQQRQHPLEDGQQIKRRALQHPHQQQRLEHRHKQSETQEQQEFEHDQQHQQQHPHTVDSNPLEIQGQDFGRDSGPKHHQQQHHQQQGRGGGGGKRHRRRPSRQKRARRWKPFTKLSWDEKRQLEERDARRAARIRAEMEAKGFPVAPYNTTQFLMEEHDLGEPDLKPPPSCRGHHHHHHGGYHRRRRRRNSSSCKTEDESSGEAPAAVLGSSSSSDGDGCSGDEGGGTWAGGDDAPHSGASDGGGGGGGGGGGDFLLRDFFETYERYHTESLNAMSKRELLQEYLELEKCLSRLQEENALLRLRMEGVQVGGGGVHRIVQLENELQRLRADNAKLNRQHELLVQLTATAGLGTEAQMA
ncbi:uncharacterized protein LOC144938238 [Lampetra fluviatilis]